MKGVIAIVVGALCASAVQAETFLVEVKGVVQSAIGQGGGVLDSVQAGDAVAETFVFDTARFPVSTGDGATFVTYTNPYVSSADAVRSRITIGAVRFDVEGYPFNFESATAYDSYVPPVPVGVPPPPPSDRFAVTNISAAVALNVADARGLVRWAAFGAAAPAASSLLTVPVTGIANVNLAEATAFTSALIEGEGWVNPTPPAGLPVGGVTFTSATSRVVVVTVQSATLRRCENRLRWLDAGLAWPRHGVRCGAAENEDDDEGDRD